MENHQFPPLMMDSLATELAVSPTPSMRASNNKSPPNAFAPSSNDSLAPLISPSLHDTLNIDPMARLRSPSPAASISHAAMGLVSPQEVDLQGIVDSQANAIHLLHDAFAAERQVWALEKDRLYQRIASLEQLLKTRDHYSPAKSPIISPIAGGSGGVTSPPSRSMSNVAPRLPRIVEDENTQPLSRRRDGAPRTIDMSGRPPIPAPTGESIDCSERASSISFDPDIKIDEVPISPPTTAKSLSSLAPNHRALAGHTPLKVPRPPTPPSKDVIIEGVDDTPTRNNTHINAFLTQETNDEQDMALTGPLSMPELPNFPHDTNFTLDALSKRLLQIEQNPEQGRPMVFAEPSPGLASPADPVDKIGESQEAEKSTCAAAAQDGYVSTSDMSSNALSPSAAFSPNGAPLSQHESREMAVQHEFEQGGIKLKKKPSVNFGAPFGSLGGFGAMRKMS